MTTQNASNNFWFAQVDVAVSTDKTLSPIDKAVYGVLCAHADKKRRDCWPKISTIAEEAGCSVRSVKNSLKFLEKRGIIKHTRRFADGKQIASLYQLIGHNAECYQDTECTTCTGGVQDVHTENENHLNEIKDSLTGENSHSAELLTAEILNTPGQESPITPEQESPIKPEESYTPQDAPEAMRSTAEYFMFKTGRKSLTERDINALCEMNGHQYPVRVQKEINTACERFIRKGRSLGTLTLEYIASSLRNQPTRGRQAKANQAKRNPDPLALTQAEINSAQPAPPQSEAEALARLERSKALLRQKDEEYKAQQAAFLANGDPDKWVEVY